MFKKLSVLLLCAFAFSCGPANPSYAQDFPTLRESTVAVSVAGGLGSGVVIAQDTVLTAAHVVENNTNVLISFRKVDIDVVGKVLKKDTLQDWAIVSVPTGTIKPMPHNCSLPKYGEKISMIGMPIGLPWLIMQGFTASDELYASDGHGDVILIDISINHGNSGGPVFNTKGEVIGIAVAGLSPEGGEGSAIGVMSPLYKFCKELN